jgi:signal peptidase I
VRTTRLDRHIRKEARLLVRDAKRLRRGKEHETEVAAVERARAKGDLVALRAAMPPLDEIVEELARVRKLGGHYQAWDGVVWIASLAIMVFTLRTFVVQVFQIPSSSMYPTLMIGDHLFVNKFVYGLDIPFSDAKLVERSPKRGEVIVFAQPCTPERDYIKRVVAVAGDTVECAVTGFTSTASRPETRSGPVCADDRDEGGGGPCRAIAETLGGITYERSDPDRRATLGRRRLGSRRCARAHQDRLRSDDAAREEPGAGQLST